MNVIDGSANGTGIIKNEWVSGGSTYIVEEGSETPIGNQSIATLTFTDEKDSVNLNVITIGDKSFNFGSANVVIEKVGLVDSFDLGTATVTIEKL